MKKNKLKCNIALTSLLDLEQLLFDPETDGLSQLLRDSLKSVKILDGVDVRFGRRVGDGLQLTPNRVLHSHREDLHVGAPQLCGRVPESIGGLSVGDEDHDTRDVGSGSAARLEDRLSDVGHGSAGVCGAAAVREGLHGSDHGAQVVVSVEVELGVRVPAVLDQADLDFVSADVEAVHQNLQEGSHFGEVGQTDAVRSVDEEHHVGLDVGLDVDAKRTLCSRR